MSKNPKAGSRSTVNRASGSGNSRIVKSRTPGSTVLPEKVKKPKILTWPQFESRVKDSSTIQDLAARFEALRIFAAVVDVTDFPGDQKFYNAYVAGDFPTMRQEALRRLRAAREKGAKVVPPKLMGGAVSALERAWVKWENEHPLKDEYPYLVKITKAEATFSKKPGKKTVDTPFQTKVYGETPFN